MAKYWQNANTGYNNEKKKKKNESNMKLDYIHKSE